MPQEYIPSEEAQLQIWLNNFASKCEKHDVILDLDTTELAQINNAAINLSNELTNASEAKTTYRSAIGEKNAVKSVSIATARSYARTFKANPSVPESVLLDLGIVSSNTSNPVTMVTGLTVVGCDNGINSLKWNRNGNSSGTQFIVEYSIGTQTNWKFAGAPTRTSFDHEGQAPGVFTWYRVTAMRANNSSVPCPAVSVYGSTGNGELTLAA
jgi:hypothetical protein